MRFRAEIFKAKTVDAFFLKSDLDPRQQSELSSDKILSNKSASFEKISLLAFRFFYKKTYTKFSRPFCLISRNLINDKTVFFLFLKEGRDTNVADILLKKKNKTNGGKVDE